MWITLLLLALFLFADQFTKYLAEVNIKEFDVVSLIPNLLNGTLTYNKGAAWSMFSDSTLFLAILSLVASIVLIYFIAKNDWKKKKCYSMAITLMLAGTYGNMIDRFMAVFKLRDGVVDMIILEPLNALWNAIFKSNFPVFNVADVCLVIGVVFIAIDVLFFQEKRAEV